MAQHGHLLSQRFGWLHRRRFDGTSEPRISGTKPTFSEHEKTFKKMVENDGFPGKMIYKCWVFHIYVGLHERSQEYVAVP